MDRNLDETTHVIFLGKFESNKKYKEQILQEILAAVCAMLNSNGGKVVIHFDTDSSIPVEGIPFSQIPAVIRILEQRMISIIGLHQTVSKVDFRDDNDSIIIFIKRADSLVTVKYNLYLPSRTQVVELSSVEPLEKVKDIIINRKAIPNPVKLGSHCHTFGKNKNYGLVESKTCQLKQLKAGASKRTTLADRMTGKGNKFTCYVSAFANHNGGHIYYGIKDEVTEGEFIPNEKDKEEIRKKVEKAINKLIWPEQTGWPKRGEHWEIFFEPVVDENCKPVPSTFVIVIYIAPCLGGVFAEQPECYEIVDRIVQKMSFDTWKRRISRPVRWRSNEDISRPVQRITWSSATARKVFIETSGKLRTLINDGDWDAILNECQSLQKNEDMKLLVLSKQATVCLRRGRFKEAHSLLEKYMKNLTQVPDNSIFELVGLHVHAALKRATGDNDGLKEVLTAALSKAELIEPGLVTATVYVFAATVSDLISLEGGFSPDILSIKALGHSQYVEGCLNFHADKKQKVHITLATFYLGWNLSGHRKKDNIDPSDLHEATTSLMIVHQSICEGNPLSWYREVQFKLVQSIYYYRLSQVTPDNTVSLLRNAFNYAKKAECIARQYQFKEMVEWSKANYALCTEELVRTRLIELKLKFEIK